MKKPLCLLAAAATLLITAANSFAQRVTVTVAGNGIAAYTGDNGPAKKASLNEPYDVCVDANHNLYFSDQNNHQIRKLTARTGIISTIAGGGSSSADGIPATSAYLLVGSVCTDPVGNVYFISSATKVQRIDALTNILTTVAGGGTSTADGVLATTASLSSLNGICMDAAGNIYIVAGNTIKKITTATGIITTIAGTGVAGYTGNGGPAIAATLNEPKYITADHSGNLYFGDQHAGSFGDVIRRIDAATGIITSVVGAVSGGTLFSCTGLSCMIGPLSGLCCDNDDNVVFNEWSCSCRKWNHGTAWVSAIGGDFGIESFHNDTIADYAYMNYNYGICSDEANNYYIADRSNNRIRKIMTLTSTPTFAFGEAQSITVCAGSSNSLDPLLWATDLDEGPALTWTVVTPPSVGTLSGFPASATSLGAHQTTKPTGLSYVPATSYLGIDSFKVRVSDGALSDIISIYVQVAPGVTVTGPDGVCVGYTIPLLTSIPGGVWSVSNPNATVSVTGVVTGVTVGTDNVLYTVNTGCGATTITHPVIIDVYPDAGVISGFEQVCEGAYIPLTDAAPGGVWSASSINATVSSSGVVLGVHGGTATILYTVTNACASAAASKLVNVVPLPDAGVISGSDEVCLQSTTTLTTTGSGGVWNAANGHATVSPSGVVTGITAGTDIIRYNVVNECGTAEATKNITIANCPPADLPELSNTLSVNVYPNPATNVLRVTGMSLATSNADLTVTDALGRIVMRKELNNTAGTKEINVSSLVGGVYMLTISGGGVHYTDKVVINK